MMMMKTTMLRDHAGGQASSKMLPPTVAGVVGGSRKAFPLSLCHANHYVKEGIALIGYMLLFVLVFLLLMVLMLFVLVFLLLMVLLLLFVLGFLLLMVLLMLFVLVFLLMVLLLLLVSALLLLLALLM